jgi:hypothetical protein
MHAFLLSIVSKSSNKTSLFLLAKRLLSYFRIKQGGAAKVAYFLILFSYFREGGVTRLFARLHIKRRSTKSSCFSLTPASCVVLKFKRLKLEKTRPVHEL